MSFLASKKEKTSALPPEWYQEIDGKRILRLLLCVGLNGTGKSKMFSALSYLRMIATDKPDKPDDRPKYRPFLLDDDSRNKPTVLTISYYIDNISYYYKVAVSADRIEEEVLRQAGNSLIYQRIYNKEKENQMFGRIQLWHTEKLQINSHVGDHLTARVDKEYRMAIARNHTATHLLQAALREVLGDHVHQAGSYQDASITHFDFTHFSAVTPEELVRVQKIVNDKIFESMNVTVKEMPIEEAKKLGAMALFGEKYGKVVRVVDIEGWSTEFCGGTHVKNTAQIGGFKIVSESSVAAGIRRIEAVTGRNLLIRANMQEAMLHTVANTLKANNVAALPVRAEAVMAENKAMSKELEDIKAKVAASKVTSLFDNAETVGDVKIASAYFTGTSGDTLRGMCDTIRDNAKAAAVAVLVGKSDDKITMAVTVTKDAQAKGLKAGNLVKEISAIAGGKGGGKPDFAMAGLKDETKIDEALAAVKSIVEKQLG